MTCIWLSERVLVVKTFLIVVVLIFSLQAYAKADNISEFEIEGLSVGDSLLNFASEQEIKKAKAKEQFPNDKYIIYRYDLIKSPTQYDWISVTAKKNDLKYIVTNIAGAIDYEELEECLLLKKDIIASIEKLFKSVQKQEDKYPSGQDKTGKSIVYGTQYYFKPYPSNEAISVNCYHMSDVSNVRKSLKVAVNVEEYAYFLINEAYK